MSPLLLLALGAVCVRAFRAGAGPLVPGLRGLRAVSTPPDSALRSPPHTHTSAALTSRRVAGPLDAELDEVLRVAEEAARRAGALIRDNIGARVKYSKTNYKDVVTEIDLASQRVIETAIVDRFPSHGDAISPSRSHSAHGRRVPGRGERGGGALRLGERARDVAQGRRRLALVRGPDRRNHQLRQRHAGSCCAYLCLPCA